MDSPLISILTPFKNTADFLPECLDSICKQTYKNWELLIVNDGSTDDSQLIVEQYAQQDSRIKPFHNEGKGIIAALRLAFKISKGNFITRMDSDDIMTPDKLEVMSALLFKKGKMHIAVGLVKYFSIGGIGNGYDRYEAWLNNLTKTGSNYTEIYKECVIPSPCWMIHREDLKNCGAFESNRYPEDYDLAFRFYKHSVKCIPSKMVLHHWRDYPSRTSRTSEHYAQNYFLDIKLDYFLELDYDQNRPLTLWGAGYKGKQIAKLLKIKGIPFIWICNNSKKIGKHIYNVELHSFEYLKELNNPQCIVTVANDLSQMHINRYFTTQNMQAMSDYYFFC